MRHYMWKAILFMTLYTAQSNSKPVDQLNLGKYPTIYNSDQHKVTLLRVGKTEENTVLIKIEGVDNEHDGQIFKHKKICLDTKCNSYKYETLEIPKKEKWWTIQAVQKYSYTSVILYPPLINKKFQLKVSKKRVVKFNSKKFYDEYLGQLKQRKLK